MTALYTEAQLLEACARVLDAAGRPSRANLLRSGDVPVTLLVLDTKSAPAVVKRSTAKPRERRQRRATCCGVTLVGTHFHWCVEVGGGGAPGTERPVHTCERPPVPEKTWGKPRPYNHPAPGDPDWEHWAKQHDAEAPCPHDAVQPTNPRRATGGVTGPTPGNEIHKDLRPVVRRLQKAGWCYDPGHLGGKTSYTGLPRVYPPGGADAVRIPTISQRFDIGHVLGSLRRAGAAV